MRLILESARILFQIENDGKTQRPIEFLSRSLTAVQRRWATADKEAYAIFYTFKRWEHHLRDREFILQTDHLNLTYVNFEGTAKVKRWKMLIQDFRFKIEYLPGPQNIVADAMSRCCANGALEQHTLTRPIDDEFVLFLEALEEDVVPLMLPEEEECFFLEVLDIPAELGLIQETSGARIPADVYAAIAAVHGARVGHNGYKRTEKRLREAGSTIERKWITQYIRECPFCQKQSYKTTTKGAQPFTLAQTQRVMQQLSLDIIGPIEEDRHGYKYILTVIDACSRWLMIYPLKTLETEEFVRALIQHVGIFGAPQEFLTDNGSTLKSAVVEDIIKLLGSTHKLSVAYSHEENAMVERWNHEIVHWRSTCTHNFWIGHQPGPRNFSAQQRAACEHVGHRHHRYVQVRHGSDRDPAHDNGGSQDRSVQEGCEAHEERDSRHSGVSSRLFRHTGIPTEPRWGFKATSKANDQTERTTYRHIKCRACLHNQELRRQQDQVSAHQPPGAVPAQPGTHRSDGDSGEGHARVHCGSNFGPRAETVSIQAEERKFLVKWKGYDDSENSWVSWHQNLSNNSICHGYCMRNWMKAMIDKTYREELDG